MTSKTTDDPVDAEVSVSTPLDVPGQPPLGRSDCRRGWSARRRGAAGDRTPACRLRRRTGGRISVGAGGAAGLWGGGGGWGGRWRGGGGDRTPACRLRRRTGDRLSVGSGHPAGL